jgi:hypothetical protein
VRVSLDFAGEPGPTRIQLPIEVYRNRTDAGRLAFPAWQSELPSGHFWMVGSGHEGPKPWVPDAGNHHRRDSLSGSAAGSYRQRQLYGYDLGVVKWNEDGSFWDGCDPTQGGDPTACDVNEDSLVWGMPVRAVDTGTVIYCRRLVPDNVPGVPGSGGGNEFLMQHSGGIVALYAHMQYASIPASLCKGGAQVSKGQFLGLAGNSGDSGGPHLHFHLQERAATGNWDFYAQGLPALFDGIGMRGVWTPPSSPWLDASGKGLVSGVVLRLPAQPWEVVREDTSGDAVLGLD